MGLARRGRMAFGLAAVVGACAQAPAPTPAAQPERSPASDTVDLVVAATTDVHGHLRGWDYFATAADSVHSLARAATIVDSLRAAAPGRVVLVDAGDMLQGTALTYAAARLDTVAPHPVVAAMDTMSYDAAVIGNHEFNYGVPTLDRAVHQARYPFLAANVTHPDGSPAYPAYTLIDRDGVKVGIVGATTPGSNLWDRDNLRGRLVVGDPLPALRNAVQAVRARGADVVVALLHAGLNEPSSYDTVSTGLPGENVAALAAHAVAGIDLIVYGHSHREMRDTLINGVLLMQPKNWATSVGVAHLKLARAGSHWAVASKYSTLVRTAGHAEDPAVLAATAQMHARAVAYSTTPIGTTPVAWRADSARVSDTPLIDFILEVERQAAGTQLASTAAFSLDASLDSGAVTVTRIAALYPYDNTLRAIRISGAQLRGYLEQSARYYRQYVPGQPVVDSHVPGYNFDIVSGVDYTLDVSKPVGQRVTRLEFNGRAVQPADTFTMALNNYRQTGGGGYAMIANAPKIETGEPEIRQLLIDEVKRRGVLRPQDFYHHNWDLVPADAGAQAYREMTRGEYGMQRSRAAQSAAPSARVSKEPPRASGTMLRVIGINDFHGALEARPDAGGVTRGGAGAFATVVRRAAADCVAPACYSVVLDAGDEFQGTPASNLAYGRPDVELMKRLGVAAAAVGNHEYDWGQDTLRARMRQAPYGFFAANTRTTTGRDVGWIRNDTIVTRGPLKIGIIGLSTVETKQTTKISNTIGLRFDTAGAIVDSLSAQLRQRGANVVLVVAHAGAFCSRDGRTDCKGEIVDLANSLRRPVDAIVSGHTHSLVNTVVNGIPITQARSRGTAVGIVDLDVTAAGTRVLTQHVDDVVTGAVPDDSVAAAIANGAVAAVASKVNRPVATISATMEREGQQYALGNLIADAMRVEGKGDVAFMNNGGIRAPLRAGVATYGTLFEVQPFGNVLYRVTVRGRDLRAYLEKRAAAHGLPRLHVSGVRMVYDTTRTVGSRIVNVTVGGAPLDDSRTYKVILNDFMATGGDDLGFASTALETRPLDLVDLDALIHYLSTQPQPVNPPAESRFIIATP